MKLDLTVLDLSTLDIRHLPGKHNQQDHGHGGTAVAEKPRLTFADLVKAKRKENQVDDKLKPTGLKASRTDDLPDPKVSTAQHKAIQAYTGDGFVAINSAHNKGSEPAGVYGKHSKDLDAAISNNRVDRDVLVTRHASYSSIGGKGDDPRGVDPRSLKGTVLTNKAFTSTSLSDEPFDFEYRATQWNIHVPKGTNGIYVDRLGMAGGEKEFILGRNTQLAIRGVRPGGESEGKWVIDAEVVGVR